jgi:3-hydroxyisobutyrate dehydrogenase-like beta-hydroxyacid dehydrogenase
MSTILPADTRRIGEALASHAVAMLDAPVTGSSPRAEAGTLTIMVGGETAEVQRARPVLEAMGELIVHVGPLGHGATLKVINQALAAANITAVAEALVLAQATELDLDALVNVISNGSGGSAMLELKSAAMRAHDYTTMFKTEHLLKDVGLSLATAAAAGVPFPSAAHAGDLLESTVADGHASDDFSAVIEAVEKRAGVRLGDS